MASSRTLLYLLASTAAATAIVMAVPYFAGKRLRIGPEDRVLLLGDSLAQGLARPLGQLAAQDGVAFSGDGRPSTRLDQWFDGGWAEAAIQAFQPTVVLVSLGTNDAGAPGLLPGFAARAAALVALAAQYGARVLWIDPPTLPDRFDTATVRAGVDASGAAVFDSAELDLERGPDAIHPTIAGFAGWAASLWQSVT